MKIIGKQTKIIITLFVIAALCLTVVFIIWKIPLLSPVGVYILDSGKFDSYVVVKDDGNIFILDGVSGIAFGAPEETFIYKEQWKKDSMFRFVASHEGNTFRAYSWGLKILPKSVK